MNRTHALIAATVAAVALTAGCVPSQTAGQLAYPCDETKAVGNDRSWCMVWDLPNGMRVFGPVWQYEYDRDHGGATVVSAP